MTDTRLEALIEEARRRFDAMSVAERKSMMQEQRRSFVKAEAAFGSDADEAEYAQAILSGDIEAIARLNVEAEKRVAMAVDYLGDFS